MCTSPAGTGGPELPPMSDVMRATFSGEGQPPEPDWSDREAAIAYLLDVERPYAGSRGVEEAAMREVLGRVYDRSTSLPSADNHFMVDGSDIERSLGEITAPALVMAGEHDVEDFVGISRLLAEQLPNARPLVTIPGAAHLPSLERPAAFDALALGFLADVYGATV
jgi:pimeloyl-ACP methyl ester carboxylesterase